MEPRYFWRPSNSLMTTPMEAQPRSAVAEPDDTRTQSFHFPLFKQYGPTPRTHSSNSNRTVATATSARRDSEKVPNDRRPTPSQSGKGRSSSKSRSRDSVSVRGIPSTGTPSQDPFPARPSSPKSRNASRSRNHERSDSALAHREHANAISQHLDHISHRAESVNKNRGVPEEAGTPQPDRPSSPKSRNCSRSRPTETLSSILIGASPSILGDERNQQSASARPMSRMSYRARAGSASDFRPTSRSAVAGESGGPRPASRAASRGRQPGLKFSPPKMSPQDPSLSREEDPDEIIRIEHDRMESIGSKPPADIPPSDPNFERIESIVCPTCPLHGRHSTGSAPGPESTSGHRVSPDIDSGRSLSSPAAVNSNESIDATTCHGNVANDPKFSATASSKPSDVSSLAETVETISASSRSPSTPSFEAKTPKAMIAVRHIDAGGRGQTLTPEPVNLIDLSCMDKRVGTTPTKDAPIAT